MFDSTVCSEFPINNNYYLWLEYKSEIGEIYYITSNKSRNEYQLWKGNKKTRYTSDNPEDLYEHIKDKDKGQIV